MGEYAKRISDGERIKIGTCESMYYLRYEDRHLVSKLPDSLDPATETGLFWRLPHPDEDGIRPGDYENYHRGVILHGFSDPGLAENPGTVQFHKFGMLVNVPCHHGEKLPENTGDIRVFFNGKEDLYELTSIKNCADGTFRAVIECRACGKCWSSDDWDDILKRITDHELRERLKKYADVKATA
jgi:hypothetical protein